MANDVVEEMKRLRLCRNYFEQGCICVLTGVIDTLGSHETDEDAVRYYEGTCTCSRNYKHLEA